MVFRASDATGGSEPWISDGTPAGTFRIDLSPGIAGSSPGDFVAAGTLVYFTAQVPGVGRELCVTDGTVAGTGVAVDLFPGAGSGQPQQLVRLANGTLLFVASLSSGNGLYRSDGALAGTALVEDGDPGPADGVRAGTLRSQGGGRIVYAGSDGSDGTAPTNIPVGACRVLVAPQWVMLPAVFLDPTGAGSTPLPIPADPALAGALLHGQYLVLDPAGQFLAFASLSAGLAFELGNGPSSFAACASSGRHPSGGDQGNRLRTPALHVLWLDGVEAWQRGRGRSEFHAQREAVEADVRDAHRRWRRRRAAARSRGPGGPRWRDRPVDRLRHGTGRGIRSRRSPCDRWRWPVLDTVKRRWALVDDAPQPCPQSGKRRLSQGFCSPWPVTGGPRSTWAIRPSR